MMLKALQTQPLSQQQLERIIVEQLQITDQTKLSTVKRRIYDTANALSSIGLIQKNQSKEYIFIGFKDKQNSYKDYEQDKNQYDQSLQLFQYEQKQQFQEKIDNLQKQYQNLQNKLKQYKYFQQKQYQQSDIVSDKFIAILTNSKISILQSNQDINVKNYLVLLPTDQCTIIDSNEIINELINEQK